MAGAVGAVAVLTALVVVGVTSRGDTSDTPSDDGPLRAAPEHGMVAEGQQGTVFTDGLEILQLQGSQPATIVRVESVGGSETFRHLGTKLAGPDRRLAAEGYLEGFPPQTRSLGKLVEAEGAVIQPAEQTPGGKGYELLIGYEIVDGAQVGYRTGVEVTYQVGEDLYSWRSPARLLYCPPSMKPNRCRAAAEADDWGE
jgi:hypothetical protein